MGWWILWHLPLGLAAMMYPYGRLKLPCVAHPEGDRMETSFRIVDWVDQHVWVFLVYALALNACFFLIPKEGRWRYARIACGLGLWIVALIFVNHAFHLGNRLLGT